MRTSRTRLVGLLVAVLAVLGLVPTTAASAVADTGHLRGTVTDTQGRPVAGATVSATFAAIPDDPDHLVVCCLTTTTAGDGSYDLGIDMAGRYTLHVGDRLGRYADAYWNGRPTPLTVDADDTVDGLDVRLVRLAHLTGRVRGADRRPLSGVHVRLFTVNSYSATPEYQERGDGALTGHDGRYRIDGVRAGSYVLVFQPPPGRWRSEPSEQLDVVGTRSRGGIDAVLALAPPVRSTAAPHVTGQAVVGRRLHVTRGAWNVPDPRVTFQWRLDGRPLPRATGRHLQVTRAMAGHSVTVRVTAASPTEERSPGSATVPAGTVID